MYGVVFSHVIFSLYDANNELLVILNITKECVIISGRLFIGKYMFNEAHKDIKWKKKVAFIIENS